MSFPIRVKALRDDLASSLDLHVWHADLLAEWQVGSIEENLRHLSVREQIRADGFLRQESRMNYIRGRFLLRRLLAIYLQRHPADVEIETTGLGKPFLAAPADSWLCFNVAHSGTQLLIAIGRNRRIGVDIERVREDVDHAELIRDHFAPQEQTEIAQLPDSDRLKAFYDCWTRKEAFLKATGSGLSTPLNTFAVALNPSAPGALLEVQGEVAAASGWRLRDVPVAPGYSAAVAAEGETLELECLNYATEFRPGDRNQCNIRLDRIDRFNLNG